jgi:hypothetical protein
MPGKVLLVHYGILFLGVLLALRRHVLEVLGQPPLPGFNMTPIARDHDGAMANTMAERRDVTRAKRWRRIVLTVSTNGIAGRIVASLKRPLHVCLGYSSLSAGPLPPACAPSTHVMAASPNRAGSHSTYG